MAMWWYRLAAVQGHTVAQYNLGAMYYQGLDAPRDYVLAHLWLSLSAEQGHESARQLQTGFLARMTPAQIAQAQQLARTFTSE